MGKGCGGHGRLGHGGREDEDHPIQVQSLRRYKIVCASAGK